MAKLDILNREEFVDKLVTLTENISANRTSTSFAINGVWGCGKSFVLDMYEERLNVIQSEETANDKYFVIRYNCWKYDYYEEPLVAIVAAMIDIINQKTKLWNDEQKKARVLGVLKAIGTTFLSMANNAIKDKTGVDVQSAYKTAKSKIDEEEAKIEESHEYDVYFSFNQALHRLQDLIAELSQDQTVIFMVDELDRCLPEYSIKVLERLHHLTENSNNVITVLSMDKEQLQTSVKQIFGFDNPEKYLEKFIQFEVSLSNGEISEDIVVKYKDYIDLFGGDNANECKEFIIAAFSGIDSRTQEQLFKKSHTVHNLIFANNKKRHYSFLCTELLLVLLIDYCGDRSIHENRLMHGDIDTPLKCCAGANGTPLKREIPFALLQYFSEKSKYLSPANWAEDSVIIYQMKTPSSLHMIILWYWFYIREYEEYRYSKMGDFVIEASPFSSKSLFDNLKDIKNFIQMLSFIK